MVKTGRRKEFVQPRHGHVSGELSQLTLGPMRRTHQSQGKIKTDFPSWPFSPHVHSLDVEHALQQRFQFLDSLGGSGHNYLVGIKQYFKDEVSTPQKHSLKKHQSHLVSNRLINQKKTGSRRSPSS
jgi:hypothetical protein